VSYYTSIWGSEDISYMKLAKTELDEVLTFLPVLLLSILLSQCLNFGKLHAGNI